MYCNTVVADGADIIRGSVCYNVMLQCVLQCNAMLQSLRSTQWSGRCLTYFWVHFQRGRWLFWWQIVFFLKISTFFMLICGDFYFALHISNVHEWNLERLANQLQVVFWLDCNYGLKTMVDVRLMLVSLRKQFGRLLSLNTTKCFNSILNYKYKLFFSLLARHKDIFLHCCRLQFPEADSQTQTFEIDI